MSLHKGRSWCSAQCYAGFHNGPWTAHYLWSEMIDLCLQTSCILGWHLLKKPSVVEQDLFHFTYCVFMCLPRVQLKPDIAIKTTTGGHCSSRKGGECTQSQSGTKQVNTNVK